MRADNGSWITGTWSQVGLTKLANIFLVPTLPDYCRTVILKMGSAEPLGSMKQGQGFRKATFVKNSVVNSKHSCLLRRMSYLS